MMIIDKNLSVSDYFAKRWSSINGPDSPIFAVCGANIEDLIFILEKKYHFKIIIAKHEFSACAMAQGVYIQSNQLGLVCTTSGGGALNLIPALGEAFQSRIPLLAIIGQPPEALADKGAFQETSGLYETFNIENMLSEVSCYCKKISDPTCFPEELELAIASAFREKRPAILLLPKNIQQAKHLALNTDERSPQFHILADQTPQQIPQFSLQSKLIIVGECNWNFFASKTIEKLQQKLQCYVAVTPNGKSLFDHDSPFFAGITGVMGHLTSIRQKVMTSDDILFIGSSFPQLDLLGIEDLLADTNKKLTFINDRSLCYLPSHTQKHIYNNYLEILDNQNIIPPYTSHLSNHLLSPPPLFYEYLNTIIREQKADVFVDAGNAGALAVHHIKVRPPQRFMVAMGMGGMGYGFGTTIGASITSMTNARKQRTFLLAGDGAFYMHGLEIHTAIEHNLPITYIITNNNAHAMCSLREELFFEVKENSCNHFKKSFIANGLKSMFPTLWAKEISASSFSNKKELDFIFSELEKRNEGPALLCYEQDPTEIPPFGPFKNIKRN